jgi:hypothetical protein
MLIEVPGFLGESMSPCRGFRARRRVEGFLKFSQPACCVDRCDFLGCSTHPESSTSMLVDRCDFLGCSTHPESSTSMLVDGVTLLHRPAYQADDYVPSVGNAYITCYINQCDCLPKPSFIHLPSHIYSPYRPLQCHALTACVSLSKPSFITIGSPAILYLLPFNAGPIRDALSG